MEFQLAVEPALHVELERPARLEAGRAVGNRYERGDGLWIPGFHEQRNDRSLDLAFQLVGCELEDLLPQARDIGLHVILTRRAGGASRAIYEPVLQRLRELDAPGLLMSGNREEGALIGNLKPSTQPPGRGTLVRRRDGVQLIQTAWSEP